MNEEEFSALSQPTAEWSEDLPTSTSTIEMPVGATRAVTFSMKGFNLLSMVADSSYWACTVER